MVEGTQQSLDRETLRSILQNAWQFLPFVLRWLVRRMTIMTTMNISLPDEMKTFIESQMGQEGYASASEYLRALIRDAQKRQARQALDAKLLEGLQSSAREMGDADWEALRQLIYERSPELRPAG
jgi:antitoxin ParD1/3/4